MEKKPVTKQIVPVSVHDDYFDGPNFAIIELDSGQINRILQLSRVVKRTKAYCIQDWSCIAEYRYSEEGHPKEKDLEENDDWRFDIERLVVTDTDYKWVACVKHTDIEISTRTMPIAELEENRRIMDIPTEELPTYIHNLKHGTSRQILEERLKREDFDGR